MAHPPLISLTIICETLQLDTKRDGYRHSPFGSLVKALKKKWKLRYVEDGEDVVRLSWHGRTLWDEETADMVSYFFV
jgi:hypothetical protein